MERKMDNINISPEVLLASLRLELLCPLCCELFRDPVLGQCGHTFCRMCASELQQRSDLPQCPQCQRPLPKTELSPNHVVESILKHVRVGGFPGTGPLPCGKEVGQQHASPPAPAVGKEAECTPVRRSNPTHAGVGSVNRAVAGENGNQKVVESKRNMNFATPTGRSSMSETVPESPEALFSLMHDLATRQGVPKSPLPREGMGGGSDATALPVFNRAWVDYFLLRPLPTAEQRKELEAELAKLGKVAEEARLLLAAWPSGQALQNGPSTEETHTARGCNGEGPSNPLLGAGVGGEGQGKAHAKAAEHQKSGNLSRFDSQTMQRNADIDAALKARGFELGETIELPEEETAVGLMPADHEATEKLADVGGGAEPKDSPENMAEMERGAAAVLSGRFSKAKAAPLELDVSNAGWKQGQGDVMKPGDSMSDKEIIGAEGLSNLQNFRFGEGETVDMRGARRLRRNANGRRGKCDNKGETDVAGQGAGQQHVDLKAEEGALATASQKGKKRAQPPRRRRKVVAGGAKPGGGKKKAGVARDVNGGTKAGDNKRGNGRGNRKRRAEGDSQELENEGKSGDGLVPCKKARRHRVIHKPVKKEGGTVGPVPAETQGYTGTVGEPQNGSQPGSDVMEVVAAKVDGTVAESQGGSNVTSAKGRKGKKRSSNTGSSSAPKRQRPADLVGQFVEIYWDGMECWYKGTVGEFSSKDKKYMVAYEDGENHWESLPNSEKGTRWRLFKEDSESPTATEDGQMAAENRNATKLVAVSDLSEEKRAMVASFCESQGGLMVDEVTSKTTHLVVVPVEGKRAKKRTEKLMRAVLHECAIVSWGWVEASIENGVWMPESEFLLEGDIKSKADWRCVKMERPLFTDLQFAVEPRRGKLQALLEELILIGGGCVLRKPAPKGKDAKLSIITVGYLSPSELRVIQAKWGKSAVRHDWIFDSVSAKTLLPQDEYQA